MSEAGELDVVVASIVRSKLGAIVDDMATTLTNTAHSSRISTSRAFACAVLDADGSVVALDNPLHLDTIAGSALTCLEYYRFETSADDIILTNDPYGGGSTVQFFTLVAPLGYEDEIVAYLAVQAHMSDIGGVVMGNYHPTAIELWAEGARFTPLKIVADGKRRRDALDTVVLNSRDPEGFQGDLDAMLATAEIGRSRLTTLIGEYGLSVVASAARASIEYAERRLRAELERIPAGSYRGEGVLDHDGQGRENLVVRATLKRGDDGLQIDLSESDEQSAGFANSPPANTRAYALLPLLALLGDDVPYNEGLRRAFDVITRPGSLVDPAFPAPTGWCRQHPGFEIAEAVSHGLAEAVPELAGLGFENQSLLFSVTKDVRIGGVEEQLAVTDYAALGPPGASAQSEGDGWGRPGPACVGLLPSIEEFESEIDVTIARFEFVPDSAGAGRWRGAPGTQTEINVPASSKEKLFACLSGTAHGHAGYAAGAAGGLASLALVSDGEEETIRALAQDRDLSAGADLRFSSPGGGGFGNPNERPVDAVRDDVVAGYVSVERARAVYGVALDPVSMELDTQQTAQLRETDER